MKRRERANEGKNERTNERPKERTKERTKEGANERARDFRSFSSSGNRRTEERKQRGTYGGAQLPRNPDEGRKRLSSMCIGPATVCRVRLTAAAYYAAPALVEISKSAAAQFVRKVVPTLPICKVGLLALPASLLFTFLNKEIHGLINPTIFTVSGRGFTSPGRRSRKSRRNERNVRGRNAARARALFIA